MGQKSIHETMPLRLIEGEPKSQRPKTRKALEKTRLWKLHHHRRLHARLDTLLSTVQSLSLDDKRLDK
ncbi:hypothetical protein K2173_019198 [Erythroxylum novogranatense]|uniref:Uncharacterized protein n=1 Tax=Erythroxylum novogranatense TaxID=1862640 RepID=A0AAV8SU03_9ROSI|nr:hypothetical protein K2173_019198 [Erythroxylum novogranatense]